MLDLVTDCLCFTTGYFEVISASSQHIYHSALALAPKKSIVWELYGSQADPFIRVVHGRLISWDTHTAATACHPTVDLATWSPCNRFIAVACETTTTVGVLDAVTLQHLQTLKFPDGTSGEKDTLTFSPDSHVLTCSSTQEHLGICVVNWDLQTGGVVGTIRQLMRPPVNKRPSIVYSANGKMAGVLHQDKGHKSTAWDINISIFNVASDFCTHSHSLKGRPLLSRDMWTQGESIRFTTAGLTHITIWEVGFTSSAPPTKVGTLPSHYSIHGIITKTHKWRVEFSSASSRLALSFTEGALVWDCCNSKFLLQCRDTKFLPRSSFSSDGCSLACTTANSEIYLWKDSPIGFIHYGTLAPNAMDPKPLLSPNGKSIVTYSSCTIQLWCNTEGFPITPLSDSAQAPPHPRNFILDLSLDLMLAAVAIQKYNVVTVVDLNSGVLQSTIDVGMEVHGLGIIKDTIIVIGSQKVSSWNLPIGNGTPGAKACFKNSSWAVGLDSIQSEHRIINASISPNSHHIALLVQLPSRYYLKGQATYSTCLFIYHTSTGKQLALTSTKGDMACFSQDGCKILCAQGDKAKVLDFSTWIANSRREPIVYDSNLKHPLEGFHWVSSCGYQVTDDWWILGPDEKWLLMLPPPWRAEPARRLWKGKFLALLHRGILEPLILELP